MKIESSNLLTKEDIKQCAAKMLGVSPDRLKMELKQKTFKDFSYFSGSLFFLLSFIDAPGDDLRGSLFFELANVGMVTSVELSKEANSELPTFFFFDYCEVTHFDYRNFSILYYEFQKI